MKNYGILFLSFIGAAAHGMDMPSSEKLEHIQLVFTDRLHSLYPGFKQYKNPEDMINTQVNQMMYMGLRDTKLDTYHTSSDGFKLFSTYLSDREATRKIVVTPIEKSEGYNLFLETLSMKKRSKISTAKSLINSPYNALEVTITDADASAYQVHFDTAVDEYKELSKIAKGILASNNNS